MGDYYSTLSGWLIPFSRAMESNGLNVEQSLKECNIDPACFADQESRLATDKFAELTRYCNKTLDKQDFTIDVAKHFHPGTLHALGYAMMSSDTLRDALERIAQYKRVVSNTCTLDIIEQDDQLLFEMYVARYEDSDRPVLNQDLIEMFAGTIVQIARLLVNNELSPIALYLDGPQPTQEPAYLQAYFGCPVYFTQGRNCIVFDKAQSEEKLIGSNPMITQAHEKILDDLLCRVDKSDLTYQIKNKIYEDLPLGAPSQSDVASHLGMSLRNLQRKLQEKGTNYKELLEQTRKKLALEYIQQRHLSLSEVGYLVGFSSVGNFNRAFKRWTNTTPGEYRSNL